MQTITNTTHKHTHSRTDPSRTRAAARAASQNSAVHSRSNAVTASNICNTAGVQGHHAGASALSGLAKPAKIAKGSFEADAAAHATPVETGFCAGFLLELENRSAELERPSGVTHRRFSGSGSGSSSFRGRKGGGERVGGDGAGGGLEHTKPMAKTADMQVFALQQQGGTGVPVCLWALCVHVCLCECVRMCVTSCDFCLIGTCTRTWICSVCVCKITFAYACVCVTKRGLSLMGMRMRMWICANATSCVCCVCCVCVCLKCPKLTGEVLSFLCVVFVRWCVVNVDNRATTYIRST